MVTRVYIHAGGNLTKRPDWNAPAAPGDSSDQDTLTYDAWNRLVQISDATSGAVATYEYDGLGRRIQKTVGSDTYDYYHNEMWQVIEVQTRIKEQSLFLCQRRGE